MYLDNCIEIVNSRRKTKKAKAGNDELFAAISMD